MSLTDTLAQGIATFEGFFKPGTLAQRNNNPGNLRAGVGQTGTDANGYAIFPDVQTGWDALYNQIALDAGRGATLQSFIYKYAPPSENNTQNYLGFLVSQLGVSSDTPLSMLGPPGTANPPTAPLRRSRPTGEPPAQTEGSD